MTFSIDNPRGVANNPPSGKYVWEKTLRRTRVKHPCTLLICGSACLTMHATVWTEMFLCHSIKIGISLERLNQSSPFFQHCKGKSMTYLEIDIICSRFFLVLKIQPSSNDCLFFFFFFLLTQYSLAKHIAIMFAFVNIIYFLFIQVNSFSIVGLPGSFVNKFDIWFNTWWLLSFSGPIREDPQCC